MPESTIYAFVVDPRQEATNRSKVMSVLKRKVNGEPNALRQSQLHKMIGCNIRAAYLGYVLESMQQEKLIMKDNQHVWALWDAPRNIAQRESREQWKRRREELERAWANSPAGQAEIIRREAEHRRLIQDQFRDTLLDFLSENEEELVELIQRLYFAYRPKHRMLSAVNC